MNRDEQLNKLVDEAISSIDHIGRPEAKPYLLTRIQARMNKQTASAWEKAGWFISRPAVAFTGLCMVLLINAGVILFNNSSSKETVADQVAQTAADEFTYTVATIYDFENNQPNDK